MFSTSLYRDDMPDYSWYMICKELGLVSCEYKESGSHAKIDYINLKNLDPININWL